MEHFGDAASKWTRWLSADTRVKKKTMALKPNVIKHQTWHGRCNLKSNLQEKFIQLWKIHNPLFEACPQNVSDFTSAFLKESELSFNFFFFNSDVDTLTLVALCDRCLNVGLDRTMQVRNKKPIFWPAVRFSQLNNLRLYVILLNSLNVCHQWKPSLICSVEDNLWYYFKLWTGIEPLFNHRADLCSQT